MHLITCNWGTVRCILERWSKRWWCPLPASVGRHVKSILSTKKDGWKGSVCS